MTLPTRLAALGPEGVFLRFVHQQTGEPALFTLAPGALLGSGAPARVFVAADHWLFADSAEAALPLLEAARAAGARALYACAPLPSPLGGWQAGVDHIYTGAATDTPPVEGVLSGDDFLASLDRLHPTLRDRVPPPPIRAMLPFRFHGLLRDGQIVSMCDTTVDDGEWVAIQQVHTPPDLRGKGFATALARGTLAWLRAHGRRPVWVCDQDNAASNAVALRAGLSLHRSVARLTPAG